MEYNELIDKLRDAKWTNPGITDEQSLEWDGADAITALIARAEAEEARAEKAEKCIAEIEEAIKFRRYSAAMLRISEYRGQKEEQK